MVANRTAKKNFYEKDSEHEELLKPNEVKYFFYHLLCPREIPE